MTERLTITYRVQDTDRRLFKTWEHVSTFESTLSNLLKFCWQKALTAFIRTRSESTKSNACIPRTVYQKHLLDWGTRVHSLPRLSSYASSWSAEKCWGQHFLLSRPHPPRGSNSQWTQFLQKRLAPDRPISCDRMWGRAELRWWPTHNGNRRDIHRL